MYNGVLGWPMQPAPGQLIAFPIPCLYAFIEGHGKAATGKPPKADCLLFHCAHVWRDAGVGLGSPPQAGLLSQFQSVHS